jgi:hypothetical protein
MRDHRYESGEVDPIDITRLVREHSGEGLVRTPRQRKIAASAGAADRRAKAKRAKASRKRNRS